MPSTGWTCISSAGQGGRIFCLSSSKGVEFINLIPRLKFFVAFGGFLVADYCCNLIPWNIQRQETTRDYDSFALLAFVEDEVGAGRLTALCGQAQKNQQHLCGLARALATTGPASVEPGQGFFK